MGGYPLCGPADEGDDASNLLLGIGGILSVPIGGNVLFSKEVRADIGVDPPAVLAGGCTGSSGGGLCP